MVNRRKQLKPVKRNVASINVERFINEDDDADSSDQEILDGSNSINDTTFNDYDLNLSPLERIIQQAELSARIQPAQQMLMKCSSPSEYDDIRSISNLSPSSSSNIPSSSSPSSPLTLLSYINSIPSTSGSNSFHGKYSEDSPLKCLERYVKPKQELTYTSKKYSSNKSVCHKSSSLRNVSTNAASAPYILPSKKESDRDANEEEGNALCELSQLVHKVGSFRKMSCTYSNNNNTNNNNSSMQKDDSCAQSVFTCLQCSRSYETLDELVFHISTTKHFTRITNKSIEPVAPWEKGVMSVGGNDKHRTRQKRLLECDAEYHLRYKHKFDSFMDWISVIRIADTRSNPDKNSIELNKLQMIINGVKK
ncbi:unnamed protein product [Anisakis simplex]|uniref:C2H2-type domain-containing protein n=1 Tax=Anisakis simplex TaxID=6269 RepID=A0A0M3K0L4_ANISI|nr:unnamed protein product [Anisakis simplex]